MSPELEPDDAEGMGEIYFHAEQVDLPELAEQPVREWLRAMIRREDRETAMLNYIFCSDEYLFHINVRYLDHDTYTDIITFDNSEEDGAIEGDIFISTDRIAENAGREGVSFERELLRVMAHGVLHLCGYEDKSEAGVALMRQKEEEALNLSEKYIA